MTQSHLAFVFPGQGSQSVGMLAELAAAHPLVKATFDEASTGAGVDLWTLSQEGPEEALNRTENTQPALLAASVAVWRVWRERGGALPARLAGHSLGEYSALVAAGALSLVDAAALVAERGRLMQAAVPPGVGAMAAIIGGDDAQIAQACADVAGDEVVSPANYNSPGQVVIAGHAAAVDRAIARLAELGVKKSVKLAVSVPSHCALMREAADRLAERMQSITWALPTIPVVQNADARAADSVEAIRDALQRQLYQPVRWTECVQALVAGGATRALECGPGKVLAGLIKRIDKSLEARAIGASAELDAALAEAAA
jgi:[acyl-carrier-protein] S-malonyltransferase